MRAEDVRAVLRPDAVLERFGVDHKRRGRELRTRLCPACGQRNRDAVCVNAETGMWCCKRCDARGDVFHLLAALAGLDTKRDFRRVVEIGAEIAGCVDVSDPEAERIATERRRCAEAKRERERVEAEATVAGMPARWAALDRRSCAGERYLGMRGIDPAELRERSDVVRFTSRGEPALPLRDLETGAIVGVQRRRVDGGEPKVLAERGSRVAGTALHGRLAELDPYGMDVAVIVEGLADTVVAVLAFPTCAVFGAPGAGQLETVAAAVAPRLADIRGWLVVAVDADCSGVDGAAGAIARALDAGLELGRSLHVVSFEPHHDLADAWRAGWRWTWPHAGGAA